MWLFAIYGAQDSHGRSSDSCRDDSLSDRCQTCLVTRLRLCTADAVLEVDANSIAVSRSIGRCRVQPADPSNHIALQLTSPAFKLGLTRIGLLLPFSTGRTWSGATIW